MYITPVVLKDVTNIPDIKIKTLDIEIDKENSASLVTLTIHRLDDNNEIESVMIDNISVGLMERTLYEDIITSKKYLLIYFLFNCLNISPSPIFNVKEVNNLINPHIYHPRNQIDIIDFEPFLRINNVAAHSGQIQYFYNKKRNKISVRVDKLVDIVQLKQEAGYNFHSNRI